MSAQPEALRLADALEISSNHGIRREAAAELRRLHAQRDALLEACRAYDQWSDKTLCYDRVLRPIRTQIRAAIKAAEGGA